MDDSDEEYPVKSKMEFLTSRESEATNLSPQVFIDMGLESVGLTPSYWSTVFAKQLGITSSQGLKHIGSEAYPHLKAFARNPVEKKVIRKLLKMQSKKGVFRDQREAERKNLDIRTAEVELLLQELKRLQMENTGRLDCQVRKVECQIRELLLIPSKYWFSKNTPLKDINEEIETFLTNIRRVLEVSDLDDASVLQNTSALKGIFLTKEINDQVRERDILLKAPENIHFTQPSHSLHDMLKVFSSKEEEDDFTSIVDSSGYAIAMLSKVGFWGVASKCAFYYHADKEDQHSGEFEDAENTYSSTVKYLFLPLASCCFSDSQLILSDNALRQLKKIEMLSGKRLLQNECEKFFRQFGSHVNKGPLHFGGRYQWKCCTSDFEITERKAVQDLQKEAILLQINSEDYTFILTLDDPRLHGEIVRTHSDALVSNTFIEVTRSVGPAEVLGFPDWKNGLLASNSTWSLIDRGMTLTSVWDIIEMNHKNDFKNFSCLAQVLKSAWEKMNENHLKETQQDPTGIAVEVIEMVKIWNQTEYMESYEEKLLQLIEHKECLSRKLMNPLAWSTFCLSQRPLQIFLKSVTSKYSQLGSPENLKRYMRQILSPSDLGAVEDVSDQQHFCRWLYSTDTRSVPMEGENFLIIPKYLRYALDQMYDGKTKSDEKVMEIAAQPSISIRVTATVENIILCFRKHLQRAGQVYEDSFVVMILFPFGCDPEKSKFWTLLSACDLECLISEMETQSKEFFQLRSTPEKVQAYLFLLSFSLYSRYGMDVAQLQITSHLHYVQKTIGEEISPSIAGILHKFYSNEYDFDDFQEQMQLLFVPQIFLRPREDDTVVHQSPFVPENEKFKKRGKKGLVESKTVLELDTRSSPEDLEPMETSHDHFHERDDSYSAVDLQRQIKEFFLMLGLKSYYPQRLSIRDALELRKDTLKGGKQNGDKVQYTDPKLYPFLILHKIMAFDYKCRIKLSCIGSDDMSLSTANRSKRHNESNDEDSDFSDFGKDEDTNTVHPMDGILALLLCSDNFLRQDVVTRLATCQLAVPLLIPEPFSDKLIFLLWAMRSIVKEWQTAIRSQESSLVDYPAPIVSFMRCGAQLQQSKSHMLNTVISDSGNDCFFHYDMDGGSAKQILVNGLIELSWYLPSNDEKLYPDVVNFVNLHGDAYELTRQVTFLCEISFINFIFLNLEDLGKKQTLELLKNLSKSPGGVIVLANTPTSANKHWKEELKQIKKVITQEKFGMIKLDKNEAEIKEKAREKINMAIKEKWSHTTHSTLEDCSVIARTCDIIVDEDDQKCAMGKMLATELKTIIEEIPSGESPRSLLPLQGPDLWHKWTWHNKEQVRVKHKGRESIQEYGEQQRKQMALIRERQAHSAQNLNALMESFLNHLLNLEGEVRTYFLQWLKLTLDNMSRVQLSHLHKEFQKKKAEVQEKSGKSTEEQCKKELSSLNKKLIDASFGLEHLLRETGQVYEAVTSKKRAQNVKRINQLPKVAAELLIEGHPLELMDGDAAHVPMTWVIEVLGKVRDILRNPMVLVLSIVGLQSTGKSTLMNTVFGLRFSVSAGRCTRGAFMQLVPLHKSLRKECKCDYFLIVDTEGLRAPELDTLQTQKHDNELATFVIGLANLTIINIYGEIPGELEDILQTAVHAFLRMKEVRLSASCHFVHQNVAAVTAGEKGKMGRLNFKRKLDEKTRVAARAEKKEGKYHSFSEVIKFDEDRDVSHFPGLWKGDPPLAPVNPGYSAKAQFLRKNLIDFAFEVQKTHYIVNLSTFNDRLKELWKAILHENFVFSFKNTLEIQYYDALETEYGQWSWTFQEKMMKWGQQTKNKLRSCDGEELEKKFHERINDLSKHVANLYEELKNKMETYFEEKREKEIIAQWKHETERRLDNLRDKLKGQAESHCKQIFASKKALARVTLMKETCRVTIREHVTQLASQLERGRLSDKQLQRLFDDQWALWIKDLEHMRIEMQVTNIKYEVEKALTETKEFKSYSILNAKLQHKEWGSHLKLTIKEAHVNAEASSSAGSGWWSRLKSVVHVNVGHKMQSAQKRTNIILQQMRTNLEKQKTENENFHSSLTVELLRVLLKEINTACAEGFPFTLEYRVDMAVTTCGYAIVVYERIVESYREKNDPVEYMEREMRKPFLKLFKDLYSQIAEEKTNASLLCSKLEHSVKKQVVSSLGTLITHRMYGTYGWLATKPSLIAHILLDIGENVNGGCGFDKLFCYCGNIKESLHYWLKFYTFQHCNQGKPSKLVNIALDCLSSLVNKIIDAAQETTRHASVGCMYEDWLTGFQESLEERIELNVKEVLDVTGNPRLKDAKNFTDEIISGLKGLTTTLENELKLLQTSDIDSWEIKPHEIIYERLVGCTEQCPFCKEQCQLTNEKHDRHGKVKHVCKMHRPQCLGGYRWLHTSEMVIDLCTTLVGSDSKYRNEKTEWEFHPYKLYKEHYPRWDITDDKSIEASLYWKWILGHYAKEIAKEFSMEETDIPDEWKEITWEDAKEYLEKSVKKGPL